MSPKNRGLHEVRTRVICHLPINSAQEESAVFEILDYAADLRAQNVGVSGFTRSSMRPAVFHGYWWPNSADQPIRDRIVLFIIDFELELDSREISDCVRDLKKTIRQVYRRHGSPQDEVWIVAHAVFRQD